MRISKFVKGLFFAWIPLLFLAIPMCLAIGLSFSSNRATGIGAVAGGISEGLAMFGLVSVLTCEIYAIVLLARTLKDSTPAKKLMAIVSIASATMLLTVVAALILWARHMSLF